MAENSNVLLLPVFLSFALGFVLLQKSTKSDSYIGIIMMLSGWTLCAIALIVTLFRIIFCQI